MLSANIVVAVVAALLSPLLTRLYLPEEFAAFAVFMTIAGILATIATGRLEYAVLLPKKQSKADVLISIALKIALIVSLISMPVLYVLRNILSDFFEIDNLEKWIWMVSPTVFLMAVFQVFTAYFNRNKHYTTLASGQIISGLSNPLSKIGLALSKVVDFGLMAGFLLSNALGSLFFSYYYFSQKNSVSDSESYDFKSLIKEYKQFPLYNLPHALSNFVSGNLPFLMLIPAFGDYTIGLYSVAIAIVFKPISLLGNAVYQVFSQKTVENHHSNIPLLKDTLQLLQKMILIGILPLIALILWSPEIFSIIWGPDYYKAGEYLRLILPWLSMVYLTSPLSFIPNLFRQQATAFAIDLLYLALRLLALWIGIKHNSFELAIALYSAIGFVVLGAYLLWCLQILKRAETGKLKIE